MAAIQVQDEGTLLTHRLPIKHCPSHVSLERRRGGEVRTLSTAANVKLNKHIAGPKNRAGSLLKSPSQHK